MDKVNVNGGAIALGHPARVLGRPPHDHAAERGSSATGGRYGLQTNVRGRRHGNATLIERLG